MLTYTRTSIPGFTGHGVAGPIALVIALSCLLGPGALLAAGDSLPSAEVILDKYVEAIGGMAAYEKLQSRVTKQRVEHVGMGFSDSVVSYQARPNKTYTKIESDAMGDIEQGCDGSIVWYIYPQMGPSIEEGQGRAVAVRAATFDADVRWREFYKKVECLGEESVDGKSCYKVVLTPNIGQPETRYFDKKTDLLVKAAKTRPSSCFGTMPLEFSCGDYRRVDGVLFPHKVRQSFAQCGDKRELLFVTESIEHNADLPPNRFELPSAVAALAKTRGITELTQSGGSCGQETGYGSPKQAGGCGGQKASGSQQAAGRGGGQSKGSTGQAGGCGGQAAKGNPKGQGCGAKP